MKVKPGLATISILMILLFSCSNGSDNMTHSPTQINTKNTLDTGQKVTNIGETSGSNHGKDVSSIMQLLQGKWQHVEDKTNYLVFEGNHRKEIAEGMDKWDEETFVLSDKCENQADKDSGIKPENDRYISCIESDICWYIIDVDSENLSLSFMGRGNTLAYKRVK